MPSQAMQDLIDVWRDQQKASASQAPPTLKERRAAFAAPDPWRERLQLLRQSPRHDRTDGTTSATGGIMTTQHTAAELGAVRSGWPLA